MLKKVFIFIILIIFQFFLWKVVFAEPPINSCEIDADWDTVMDCDDIMPKTPWSPLNDWAPILDNKCTNNCTCQKWYECTSNNPNTCSTEWICVPKKLLLNKCLQNNFATFIVWEKKCSTCPCENSLDFLKSIRKCDYIFPAITSLDSKQIYSKWDLFRVY